MKRVEIANFPEFEAEMLKLWAKEKTFEASLKQREKGKPFSFYDGPPFANGLPHYGHVVALTQKDAVTRYKTMQGYYVPRRAGWDTHGLPVEVEVEKQLGISGKRQILELGIDKFNAAARASVFKYREQWEEFMLRLGRWSDQANSYATLDNDYIESVWWVLAELDKKGLVYQGFRCNPYCPRCATPLSNFELNQGYRDGVEDPSVFVKFPLTSDPQTAFLAWTTTPWTLPANSALAVDEESEYVTIKFTDSGDSWQKGEQLILAAARLDQLAVRPAEYAVIETRRGADLVGLEYVPLYESPDLTPAERQKAYRVYGNTSVSLSDGTGIVHTGTRYGETDLALCLLEGLPMIETVNKFGMMEEWLTFVKGQFFKDADPHIIADLTAKGRIFAAETFTHTYPFCWRCETPLLYFSMPSWFIEVTRLREQLVANNQKVHWVPDHIKEGRFGNWLAEARDWNISRNRFWGAPLPIWVNEKDTSDRIIVRSLAELRELSGKEDFDLHRPGIDEVVITRNGQLYRRVEEVFDCWFESGSMPYAQQHYPFENKQSFSATFPADFIAEGLDQTRGWFYTLHVLATALFDQPAFKHVIVNGLVLAGDGKKLSKSLRNYPDPEEIFSSFGADSLRFFLMSSPVMSGEDVRFSTPAVGEVMRNVFMTLWNVYSFYQTYAMVSDWSPSNKLVQPASSHILDQWMMARVAQTVREVTKQADGYELARAVRPLRELIDDLSNWYLRRSRRRLGRGGEPTDSQQAFATLHYVLVTICQLLAPWSPFLPDKLWRELTQGMELPQSVHLSNWPVADPFDDAVLANMATARVVIAAALAQRAEAKIKVRQPLASLQIKANLAVSGNQLADYQQLVIEEVNVKDVKITSLDMNSQSDEASAVEIKLDTDLTPELRLEGVMRDIVRLIQAERKAAGLTVDDEIKLVLSVPAQATQLAQAIKQYESIIKEETRAVSVQMQTGQKDGEVPRLIEGEALTIHLQRV